MSVPVSAVRHSMLCKSHEKKNTNETRPYDVRFFQNFRTELQIGRLRRMMDVVYIDSINMVSIRVESKDFKPDRYGRTLFVCLHTRKYTRLCIKIRAESKDFNWAYFRGPRISILFFGFCRNPESVKIQVSKAEN